MTKSVVSRQALGLLALASSVSACTLIDPHRTTIDNDEKAAIMMAAQKCPDLDPKTGRVPADKIVEGEGLSPYCQFYGQLPAAIAYAYAQSEEFDGAVSSQSVLKNGIALGVIPAAAAGLFLGLNGGHTDALLALASGSAAALGLGSFLNSEPRQAVYISGSLAIACSIVKAGPYLLDQDEYEVISSDFTKARPRLRDYVTDAARLAERLRELDLKIVDLEKEIKNLQPDSEATVDSSEIRLQADSAINLAEQALVDAAELTPKVLTTRMKVNRAPTSLSESVHAIAEQVSREVTKTEPDINTIRALASQIAPGVQAQIAGINSAKDAIAPAVRTETTPGSGSATNPALLNQADALILKRQPAKRTLTDAEKARLQALQTELAALITSRAQMTEALRAELQEIDKDRLTLRHGVMMVEPLIDAIAVRERLVATIPDCVVEAAQVGFSITPPVTELPIKVGETRGIIVNGAVGTATGTVVEGKPNGIVFETKGNGTGLVVNMTAKVPGNYVVAISDTTGKGTKTINVSVATGLTLKSGEKVVEDTVEVAKGSDTKIDITGGNGALATLVPGSQTELTVSAPTGDSAKGSVTINAKGAGPYNLTIKAGEEKRDITITVKK